MYIYVQILGLEEQGGDYDNGLMDDEEEEEEENDDEDDDEVDMY
jgi:hypothetical protein